MHLGTCEQKALPEPRASLRDFWTTATVYKITFRGHNKASFYDILFNRFPILSAVCNPREHGRTENDIAKAHRRQIQAELNAKAIAS